MNGYRYIHTHLDATAVRKLALTLCGTPAYLYSQTVKAASLLALTPDFDLMPEGRAFGPDAEVRWQQVSTQLDVYRVLVLRETAHLLGAEWETAEFEVSEKQHIYLLGVWQPKEKAWIEVRLPNRLDYPLADPGKMARPIALAIEYRCAGMVQYIRLLGLQTEPVQEAR